MGQEVNLEGHWKLSEIEENRTIKCASQVVRVSMGPLKFCFCYICLFICMLGHRFKISFFWWVSKLGLKATTFQTMETHGKVYNTSTRYVFTKSWRQ